MQAAEQVHTAIVRQIPRRLWQLDNECDSCSLLECTTIFGSWQRKHHCRQCGRVVCASCSSNKKLLFPPKGHRGPARKARVCNACCLSQDTFIHSISTTSLCSLVSEASSASDISSGRSMSPSRQILPNLYTSPLAGTFNEIHAFDNTCEFSPNQDVPCIGSPNMSSSEDIWISFRSNPISCPGAKVYTTTEKYAIESLLQDVFPDSHKCEWINHVKAKFKDNPHFYAMLKYEPKALKMMIMSTIDCL